MRKSESCARMMSWMESNVFIHCRCERSTCSSRRKFSTAMANCRAQVCRKSSSSGVQWRLPELPSSSNPMGDFLPTTGSITTWRIFSFSRHCSFSGLASSRLVTRGSGFSSSFERSSVTSANPASRRKSGETPTAWVAIRCPPSSKRNHAACTLVSFCNSSTADCTMLPYCCALTMLPVSTCTTASLLARVRAWSMTTNSIDTPSASSAAKNADVGTRSVRGPQAR